MADGIVKSHEFTDLSFLDITLKIITNDQKVAIGLPAHLGEISTLDSGRPCAEEGPQHDYTRVQKGFDPSRAFHNTALNLEGSNSDGPVI